MTDQCRKRERENGATSLDQPQKPQKLTQHHDFCSTSSSLALPLQMYAHPYDSLHSVLVATLGTSCQRRRERVRFSLPLCPPPGTKHIPETEEPRQTKRRRFQRRNSKTASMLFPATTGALPNIPSFSDIESSWERLSNESVGVAEKLVSEIKKRHNGSLSKTSPS